MIIILLGICAAVILVKYKKQPERVEFEIQAPLVKIEQVRIRDIPMVIQGYGTVNPKVEVDIIPEVSGKVIFVHPELKVGGFIRRNENILQIDPRDYELAVRQAEAGVADTNVLLETEEAEAQVARKEWRDLHPGTEPSSTLVLREPQIRKAKAALDSAEAQLATAKLRLDRTNISLPFDIMVASESVDMGQYVVAGQSLASAFGTKAVEIVVPLQDDDLAWFDAFGNSILADGGNSSNEKTVATIKADFAGTEHVWKGYVVRTTGQVDRSSRMISVIVDVPDPFDVSKGGPPLLPGLFVEVSIHGKTLNNVAAIPRDAMREGNKVWLVEDNVLRIQFVDVIRADKDFAYIASGIDDKANVVTSSMDVAVDGMKIRTEAVLTMDDEQMKQDSSNPFSPEEK
ncbi:MAG: efflux RND transporter periplasmic adaptor subunit [Sedimentisphaerales bacterium]|nr:efflux RND transporter periplasmic adaptor subunit [Sedimentisphaerales bacterium]